jgi:hypothetical protein
MSESGRAGSSSVTRTPIFARGKPRASSVVACWVLVAKNFDAATVAREGLVRDREADEVFDSPAKRVCSTQSPAPTSG